MKEVAFPVYFNWHDRLKEFLAPDERCEIIDALRDYYEKGTDPVAAVRESLRLSVALMFDQIVFSQEKAQKAVESGRRGGKSSASKFAAKNEEDEESEGPSEGGPRGVQGGAEGVEGPSEAPPSNKKKNTNTNKNKNTNTKRNKNKKDPSSRSLSYMADREREEAEREIPTLGDVRAYVDEAELFISPDKFFNYYQSVGWREKGQPITDWRSKARLWDEREHDFAGAKYIPSTTLDNILRY